jgi:hypothetical protein
MVARPTLGTLEFGLLTDSRRLEGDREKEVRRGATEKERRRIVAFAAVIGNGSGT